MSVTVGTGQKRLLELRSTDLVTTGEITSAGDLNVNSNLDFSGGDKKKIILGTQEAYALPAQGTKMRILTLANLTSCRVYIDSSENSYNQPIVLDIFYNSQSSAKPVIHRANNYQWHTHSNDIRFTCDTSGHIYAEKVSYSTGRTVNIRKVEEFKGTVTILDGSTTQSGGGSSDVQEGKFGTLDITGNISVGGTVDGIDIATRDAILTSTTTTAGAALPKAGGTMTGALTLSGAPTANLHAATKAYVDAQGGGGTVTGTGVNNRIALWNGTTAIDSDSDFYVDGDTIFTTNLEASGKITTTGINENIGNVKIRNYFLSTNDTGGYFLLGKIEHNANSDGAVSATCHFAYDYGSTTNNCTLHFNFAQRSGTARGTWWYEGDDQDAAADRVHARLIDDGSGGMYVWVTCVDYAQVHVEARWRLGSEVINTGQVTATAGLTTGTTLFDTANDPTAEMHIGKLYAHDNVDIDGNAAIDGNLSGTNNIIYGSNATGTTAISGTTLDASAMLKSGFYKVNNTNCTIPNASSVNFLMHTSYNVTTNQAGFDLAANDSTTSQFYLRPATGGGKGAWQTIITDVGTQTISGVKTFTGDVITTDGSDTATLKSSGITLSRSNSYIQSNADNQDTLNIGQSSVRWGNVKVDGATFKVLNGGTERFGINSSGNSTFAGTIGSGAITSTGKITGTELEGTSLDINGAADIAGALDVHGAHIRAHGGDFILEDSNSDTIHFRANSNSTEGVIRLSNGSNWGLIARGTTNSPRLGAYHNGTLDITGFGDSAGANHADDDLLAQFDFANEQFTVNGEIEGASLDINGNADISSNLTVDGQIVAGGQITGTELEGTSLDINGNADISGDLTVGGKLIITGDIDSYNVTNLDIADKTISVNVGGTAALANGAGLIVDRGSSADATILWDHSNSRFNISDDVEITNGLIVGDSVVANGVTLTGNQTVTDSTSTTSSTTVASATAVKSAYDRGSTGVTNAAAAAQTANGALQRSGGTMSGAIAMGDNDVTGLDELIFSNGTKLGDDGADNYLKLTYGDSGAGGILVYDGDGTRQGYLYADGNSTPSFGLLDGSGAWAVRCLKDSYVELRHDNAVKLQTAAGGVLVTGELEATSLDINGAANISGTLSGNFVVRSTNNANTDGANFAVDTTNKTTAEYAYEVLRSGTTVGGIRLDGKVEGTEIEGTSLDINGSADISGNITSATWAGDVIPEAKLQNQSGTNTGDQTTITGNAGTVTNGVYTNTTQTITGAKTFSGGIGGSNSLMTSFFLPQNPEGSHVKAPWFFNDMAYARLRGATVTVTVNGGSSPGTTNIDAMLDASTGFWNMATSGVSSVVVEITNPPKTMYHGAHYGVTFGNTNWRANSVDIHAYYSGAYQEVVSITGNSKEFIYGAKNSGGNAVSKIKWTFSDFNTTSMRVVSLFAYNYDAVGMPSLYLTKDGGEMYGAIDMNSNKITELGTPTANADAATKAYVDGAVIANTDTQDLSISGQTLSLTNGGSVTLPDTNTQLTLNNTNTSTSTTEAATANTARIAYNRGSSGITAANSAQTTADAALPKAGGTMSGNIAMGNGSISGATNITAESLRCTNIVTNKVVKFDGTQLNDSTITDTGTLITLGANTSVDGTVLIGGLSNASADTDRFLVADGTKTVRFRTGAEVRSDIGAGTGNSNLALGTTSSTALRGDLVTTTSSTSTTQAATANAVRLAYSRGNLGVTNAASAASDAADAASTAEAALPKSGGTMTGNITLGSNKVIGMPIVLGSASGMINRTAAQFTADGSVVYVGSNNYGWNDARDWATQTVSISSPTLDQNDQYSGIICPVNLSQVTLRAQVRMNSQNGTMIVKVYKMNRATAVSTNNLALTEIGSLSVSTMNGRFTTADIVGTTSVSAGQLILVGFGKTDSGAGQKPRFNFTLSGTTS